MSEEILRLGSNPSGIRFFVWDQLCSERNAVIIEDTYFNLFTDIDFDELKRAATAAKPGKKFKDEFFKGGKEYEI